jgi:flagellar L-ring protein FlgH
MTKNIFAALAIAVAACGTLQAADKKPVASDNYDELLARYLESARRQPVVTAPNPGSWMNSLMADQRARRVNDLITVRVVESISASGSADSNLTKSGSASAAVPGLFGLEKKLPSFIDPTSLASLKHDSTFKGAGATNRASDLTATITARVAEVLPNGDLVVEGVREIEINGDRQIVVLTGIARTADVGPGNVVLSTTLGQLQIKYFGRGLIKDSLEPGFLIKMLNKIF